MRGIIHDVVLILLNFKINNTKVSYCELSLKSPQRAANDDGDTTVKGKIFIAPNNIIMRNRQQKGGSFNWIAMVHKILPEWISSFSPNISSLLVNSQFSVLALISAASAAAISELLRFFKLVRWRFFPFPHQQHNTFRSLLHFHDDNDDAATWNSWVKWKIWKFSQQ